MKESVETTAAINATRDMLQQVIILLDSLSARMEVIEADIVRIKESQNELLAGLALYERVKKFKEDLVGHEVKPSPAEDKRWDNMEAYCSNCTKMVPIIDPVSTLKDGRMTVRAKCKSCGAQVFRTLS